MVVDVGHGMAWVWDSLDRDPVTYKDFVAIVKTYVYHTILLFNLVPSTFEY